MWRCPLRGNEQIIEFNLCVIHSSPRLYFIDIPRNIYPQCNIRLTLHQNIKLADELHPLVIQGFGLLLSFLLGTWVAASWSTIRVIVQNMSCHLGGGARKTEKTDETSCESALAHVELLDHIPPHVIEKDGAINIRKDGRYPEHRRQHGEGNINRMRTHIDSRCKKVKTVFTYAGYVAK